MDEFPFEKAVFSSDMLNDEEHIFMDCNDVTYGFGFIKIPIKDNLIDTLHNALKELSKYGYHPNLLFVPFKPYHEKVARTSKEDVLFGQTFRNWVKYYNLQLFIMTPDYLKDQITL